MADEPIIPDAGDPERQRPMPSRRMWLAGAAAGAVVIAGLFVSLLAPGAEVAPTTLGASGAPFAGDVGASYGRSWLEAVRLDDIDLWGQLTHPDSAMRELPELAVLADPSADVIVDQVPFGSLSQPQLCYLIRGSDSQETGSLVYRSSGGQWLVYEIRPGVDSCHVPDPIDQ